MNEKAIENRPPMLNPPVVLGTPSRLVFDDDSIEGMLYQEEAAGPTPASVLELWDQGLDRSESCARAVAAVLINYPDAIEQIRDLDAAEACLRQALQSKAAHGAAAMASCWSGLGRILESKNQLEKAEDCYRKALCLLKEIPTHPNRVMDPVGLRLLELLRKTGRGEEARKLGNRIKADHLGRRKDKVGLSHLRSTALDMVLAGQYAEAETAYRRLEKNRFELTSTHCHLARVYLMMNRETDAKQEVEKAWAAEAAPPAYLVVRIRFLRVLLAMLEGHRWKLRLLQFRRSLTKPGAHNHWTMQPVLDHLKPRLEQDQYELLKVMLAAAERHSKVAEFKAHPVWVKEKPQP